MALLSKNLLAKTAKALKKYAVRVNGKWVMVSRPRTWLTDPAGLDATDLRGQHGHGVNIVSVSPFLSLSVFSAKLLLLGPYAR